MAANAPNLLSDRLPVVPETAARLVDLEARLGKLDRLMVAY